MTVDEFPALTGYYKLLFLYAEVRITILPAPLMWSWPGPGWFYSELVPGARSWSLPDDRARMAILQLGSCYMLLGLITSFAYRAVRDAVPNNPLAQGMGPTLFRHGHCRCGF
ncbi:hypothetical protein BKA62DRAFT_694092 [Auriculariales sp. MPI-PUGE-AT-0066]|nr:hypothetical protein BKA62DRAFT_694092 [Auriculariales sp. MPI-PUGE-AT-0066]